MCVCPRAGECVFVANGLRASDTGGEHSDTGSVHTHTHTHTGQSSLYNHFLIPECGYSSCKFGFSQNTEECGWRAVCTQSNTASTPFTSTHTHRARAHTHTTHTYTHNSHINSHIRTHTRTHTHTHTHTHTQRTHAAQTHKRSTHTYTPSLSLFTLLHSLIHSFVLFVSNECDGFKPILLLLCVCVCMCVV